MEAVPDLIEQRRKLKRNNLLDAFKTLPGTATVHPYMVIVEGARWRPGRTITVAFKGGSSDLHSNIERIASEWSNYDIIAPANQHRIDGRFGRHAHLRAYPQSDAIRLRTQ